MTISTKGNNSEKAMPDYITPSWVRPWWRPWMGYILAMIGFLWATAGFFNFYFKLGLPELIFNRFSEIFVIAIYGVPVIIISREKYQRFRLTLMVSLLVTFWYIIPVYFPFNVNLFGLYRTDFPSLDMPGSLTNILLLILGLLFGRRVKCGWMNTCVAIKETAGAPFRRFTAREPKFFNRSKIKIITSIPFLICFILIFTPAGEYKSIYLYWFWTVVIVIYFGALFLSPIFGPRVWCRWMCPLLFGWVNVLGFFRLRVDKNKCTECGACEKRCDMGVPIVLMSKKNPSIKTTECIGCGRCRDECKNDAIRFYDVRDFIKEKLLKKDRDR